MGYQEAAYVVRNQKDLDRVVKRLCDRRKEFENDLYVSILGTGTIKGNWDQSGSSLEWKLKKKDGRPYLYIGGERESVRLFGQAHNLFRGIPHTMYCYEEIMDMMEASRHHYQEWDWDREASFEKLEEEKTQYEELQRQNTERNAGWNEYNAVKEAHPDDMVLYQVGDFFELYGEDARQAAELLDLNLTTRNIPDAGRVAMCGIPAHRLEQYVEDLRDKYDVTISAVDESSHARRTYTMLSIDHEADRATDAYEAEFGADGYRAFPGNRPEDEPPASDVQAQLDKYLPIVEEADEDHDQRER